MWPKIFIAVYALISAGFCAEEINFEKFTRFECNATDNVCSNLYCKIRSVSRYQTFISAGCDLQKTLNKIFVNMKASIKTPSASNFHQFVDLKDLNLCALLSDASYFPAVRPIFNMIQDIMGRDLLHECPYSGSLRFDNMTLGPRKGPSKHFTTRLPNALYRFHIKAYDKTGASADFSVGMEARYHAEVMHPRPI